MTKKPRVTTRGYLIEYQLEKFCLSITWNLENVCEHNDTQWKVFSLSKSECLPQLIQMKLSRNHRNFSEFFLPFQNLRKIFNTLEKKINLRGYLFLKLYTAKSEVT